MTTGVTAPKQAATSALHPCVQKAPQSVVAVQTAIESAVDAFDDKDWGRSFSSLSGRVAAVGPTHRAHLAALKLLPANTARGFALQQAGAAALLQGLLKMPSQVQALHRCVANA